MKYVIFLVLGGICTYITALGYQDLINFFFEMEVSLWATIFLGLTLSFLRASPFAKRDDIHDMDSSEVFTKIATALVMDCLAVFIMIPYAIELLSNK
jgi:hypothetical protein